MKDLLEEALKRLLVNVNSSHILLFYLGELRLVNTVKEVLHLRSSAQHVEWFALRNRLRTFQTFHRVWRKSLATTPNKALSVIVSRNAFVVTEHKLTTTILLLQRLLSDLTDIACLTVSLISIAFKLVRLR
jgi:hypothetical protein